MGLLIGGVQFGDLSIVLKQASGDAAAVTLNYGLFIQTVVDFLIVAAAIFVAVKVMNKLKRTEENAPSAPPNLPFARMSASTLRLKLIKVGAVIIRNTRRVRVLMSDSYPFKDELSDLVRRLVPG